MSDRKQMARWYAARHVEIDPDVVEIFHLPNGAAEQEIRLLEVNDYIIALEPLKPLDYAVDVGNDDPHKLLVVDVTPDQMERIKAQKLELPTGWSLEGEERLYGRTSA